MATITFRSDADVDRALDDLRQGGDDRSQVIREAILLAWRTQQDERLLAEAQAVASDPADRDEARAVLSDMDDLRAW
jgi:hypothetical protein